jgi:hypothetical protein
MLPRAAPRPRARACTLESSLRCLRGSSSSPVGCWKFEKIDLPPTMLDRRFKSRHLLTQRRACCPGLPRGPEQAPAPWSPPSAACAPRIIEFSGGCWKFEKIDLPPTMLDRRVKSRPEAVLLPEFILIPRIQSEYIPVCFVVYEGGGNIGSKAYPVSSSVTIGIKSVVSAINIPGLGPSKMHLWPCNLARTGEKSNRLALGMVPVSSHSDVNIIILASGCREQCWQSWE